MREEIELAILYYKKKYTKPLPTMDCRKCAHYKLLRTDYEWFHYCEVLPVKYAYRLKDRRSECGGRFYALKIVKI